MGDVAEELRELEESLWQPLTRMDAAYMEGVLAPGFFEFTRSGRKLSCEEVIALPLGDFATRTPLPEFAVRMIADDVALVTYKSEVRFAREVHVSNRASLWRRYPDAGWRLEFHQDTPAET